MKTLRIRKLMLQNFKGVPELTLNFNGGEAAIYGRNEAGKTTVVDSVMWLFFNKDSQGSAKFSIKPLVNGVPESNLEHIVEGVFFDGEKDITLKKVYKEKWTKKRGSLNKEFTGHETTYYIDEVGTPAKKFQAAVAELTADQELFQLLSSPTFFSEQLAWKKRREMIIGVVGDITDEEVIATDGSLSDVPDILDGKSIEDRMTVIAQAKKQINEDIKSIPGRIDEKKRSLPDLEVTNSATLVAKLTKLQEQLASQNEKIAALKVGGGAVDIKNQITVIDSEIANLHNKFALAQSEKTCHEREELANLKDQKANDDRVVRELERDRESYLQDIKQTEEVLKNLRDQFKEIASSEFGEDTCSSCGQKLPEDQLEELRARFNKNKAEQLEKNNATGGDSAKKLKALKASVEAVTEKIMAQPTDLQEKITALEATIKEAAPETPLEETEEYIKLIARKEDLRAQLENIEKSNSEMVEAAVAERVAIEEDIKIQNAFIAQIEQYQKDTDRIAELKKEESDLGTQYEDLEGQLYVLENFIKAKVSLLEGRVAEKFGDVGFKMFSPQINGGLTETCEATVNGVPYADLNSAAKVQSGISIINTFAQHYEFTPFIFVDNRESVTDIPETEAQVISLVVSPEDKVLRLAA